MFSRGVGSCFMSLVGCKKEMCAVIRIRLLLDHVNRGPTEVRVEADD